MGTNLCRFIERFHFTEEGRESFLKNLAGLVRSAAGKEEDFPLHPEFFWPEDLSGWDPADRDRLLSWLYAEAKEAARNSTADYDYSVAPEDLDEMETEVAMIQYSGAIWRVLELGERRHLAAVRMDGGGRPYLKYPDGRVVSLGEGQRT